MSTSAPSVRPPWWRDERTLRIVGQLVFLGVVITVLAILYSNAQYNLRRTGLPTGFDFLNRPAGFNVADSPFNPRASVWRAILVGVGNTLRVSVAGIVLATIIGTLVGIARLSTNWLVAKAAALYVETLRNVPVLVIILVAAFAVVGPYFPPIDDPAAIDGVLYVTNRGVWVPWPRQTVDGGALLALGLLVVAVVAGWAVARWRTAVNQRTGEPHHRVLWAVGVGVGLFVLAWLLTGQAVTLSTPSVAEGAAAPTGGIKMPGSYTALLFALTIYTASHIAEIVRGSILAVPNGQTEAGQALALSGFQRMRFVILPQAMRIAVPPIANQYLNLTKNSSLAIAIGYPEITTQSNIIIGNANPALQVILIAMGWYLLFSLTISLFANIVNRRLQLVER